MAYTKQVWRDLETGGTPITAEKLNHIEDGIEENSNNWDSISHKIVSVNETIASQGQVFVTLENIEGYTCVSCMFDGTSTNSLAFSVSAPMHSPNSGLTYTRIINLMSDQITVKGTITAVYMRI